MWSTREYITRFLKIRDKDGHTVPFRLNPPQERYYETIEREWNAGKPVRIIILKARQMGFSTLTEGVIFKLCATQTNTEAMIVAHTDEATRNIFAMSKRFYEELPAPLRPMQKASNAQELIFDKPAKSKAAVKGLGSRIRCATAGGHGVGRSYTLRAVHASEFAFWPGDKNEILTGLMQAVPDRPGTIVVIESTANGYDEFKTLWDEAVKAQRDGTEGFVPIFFAWYEMPEYRRAVPPGFQRTQEEQELAERYHLDDEQLAWRRWCIATNCQGKLDMFHQEYPSCPDEAFLATGSCIFDQEILAARRAAVMDDKWDVGVFRMELDDAEKIRSYSWHTEAGGALRIRKHPEKGVPYVIGADTAGDGSDYFAAHVLDNRTGEQVAVLHHRYGEREFSQQLYCLGKYYNNALVGIETNYSTYPELKIEELGYRNLYVRQRVDTYTGKLQEAFGFSTNTKTRPLIIDGLKDVVLQNAELLTDYETMGEMLTFVRNQDTWKAEAEEGKHDDLVMSMAIAHYIRPQQRYTAKAEKESMVWTADMLEDWNHADRATRELMEKNWGKPRRR